MRRGRQPGLISLDRRVQLPGSQPNGGVAQLGERWLCKPEVAGSIPVTSTGRRRQPRSRRKPVASQDVDVVHCLRSLAEKRLLGMEETDGSIPSEGSSSCGYGQMVWPRASNSKKRVRFSLPAPGRMLGREYIFGEIPFGHFSSTSQ